MLTVKHIVNKSERIWSAIHVHHEQGTNTLTFVNGNDAEAVELHGGKVFVMNENGATVGSYILE